MSSLVETVKYVNEREIEASEKALSACFPPPPPLSQEAQQLLIPFVQYCTSHKLRPVPAKICSVAGYINWAVDNRRPEETIFESLAAIDALHTAAGVGSPVAAATALTTIAGVPIDPPRSWRKDEKEAFALLPVHVQWVIARRELDREKELRRGQNEIAEMKKRLKADAATIKSAETTNEKEFTNG
jgi:hypothetical protein